MNGLGGDGYVGVWGDEIGFLMDVDGLGLWADAFWDRYGWLIESEGLELRLYMSGCIFSPRKWDFLVYSISPNK